MKKLALYKCFNPVAPTRGATGNNGANGLPAQLFQSTHPHGVRRTKVFTGQLIQLAFQSTHPHGVRRGIQAGNNTCLSSFNPRTHTGCDEKRETLALYSEVCFNPRTHTGCDPFDARVGQLYHSFNPRTHTGCDITELSEAVEADRFQSTHPHGVRHPALIKTNKYVQVSIHAPTRGATQKSPSVLYHYSTFQSTHPHGVRRVYCALMYGFALVSIHAPTRGATHSIRVQLLCRSSFNPRTHTGCDVTAWLQGGLYFKFQSTHPHGVRRPCVSDIWWKCHVSIHAPTRGATPLAFIS